jgi:uncharacterized membrane protein
MLWFLLHIYIIYLEEKIVKETKKKKAKEAMKEEN